MSRRFEVAADLHPQTLETIRQNNEGAYPEKIYIKDSNHTNNHGQECEWAHLLIEINQGTPRYLHTETLVEDLGNYLDHIQEQYHRRD